MAPRDDFPNSSTNDVVPQHDGDTTEQPIETMPIEETQQEVDDWAQSEGYTPLAGLQSNGGGVMFMVAAPQDDDDDEEGFAFHPSQGAFFADMNAFETTDIVHDDDEEAETDEADKGFDFRSVADDALKALEDDYSMTVRGINVEKDNNREEKNGESSENVLAADADSEEVDEEIKTEEAHSQETEKKASPLVVTLPKFEPSPPPAPIDTEAVQRAVSSIQLKDSKLSQRFHEWQETFEQHPIIPSAPLAAFRKKTAKARQATANLSRSATIVHALHRLQILPCKHLVLHILGVDHVETNSVDLVRTTFGPMVRWLAASSLSPESIELLLIGPNVVEKPSVDLMPKVDKSPLKKATATCHPGEFHELDLEASDLAIAFNAGVWGYDSWVPTLEKLKAKLVVTSYTMEEAEDDADVLEPIADVLLWAAESNPFGSNVERDTKSIQNRVYRENAAWQAWQMK